LFGYIAARLVVFYMASQTVGIPRICIIFGSCWFLRSDSNYSYLQIEANSFEKFDILWIE